MKISALRLYNVKRFGGRGVAIEGIGDGVNVLSAANEFGKSTSFEALHALFFQPHSGTPGDVQRLRPYSGGNPRVEVDLATSEGRFRVTKQYYGGRFARVTDLATGRLIAQADEAENFLARLVGGDTAGPAGLLWVRQGLTGLEKRSKSEEDGDRKVRLGLLESVQGEVEAVTGGRRMGEIMSAVKEALDGLVTPTGRPKAGERYAAAIEERDRLASEKQRFTAEVGALREALDRRAGAMRRLDELEIPEEREERRQAVVKAEANLDRAKAQGEAIRSAEVELRFARDRRERADKDLTSFRDGLRKAKALQDRLPPVEAKRAQALERRRSAEESLALARAAADRADAEEREARARLAELEAAVRAREAAERLVGLESQLAEAEAARSALEEKEAALAQLKLPEKSIEALEALDIEIAKLQAVAAAIQPSVAITYEEGAAAPVLMDGSPLVAGEIRAYAGQAALMLPGIGVLTLQSSAAVPEDGAADVEATRRRLLARMGVDSLADARRRQIEADRVSGDLRELRARLSLLAPDGLPKLREAVAARRAVQGERLDAQGDPEELRGVVDVATLRHRDARQAREEATPMLAAAVEAVGTAQAEWVGLAAEQGHLEAILGPQETRSERERGLASALAEAEARLGEVEAKHAKLSAAAIDLASAEATVKRVRSVAETADAEAGKLREAIAGFNAEIRTRSDEAVEEQLAECAEALDAAEARVSAFRREADVLRRLSSALENARSEARELYLKPVMVELQPLLGLLFDDVSITFDEKTLLPQTILRQGQEEDVERLSGGMREQLSVLTRLAFARLLARNGRPAPVILDDALVYSDDDRIEKMFDALHRQARDQQIIVFSCRQRAFQKLGGNVLQMTDWVPKD